jgi:hypothetical protein
MQFHASNLVPGSLQGHFLKHPPEYTAADLWSAPQVIEQDFLITEKYRVQYFGFVMILYELVTNSTGIKKMYLKVIGDQV